LRTLPGAASALLLRNPAPSGLRRKSRAGPSVWPPADHVTLPQLAERVLCQPVLQPFGVQPLERRAAIAKVGGYDVTHLEMVDQRRGLGSDQQLTMPGCRF